jgi:glutamate-ammonia-ligase adenylyltransferase
LRGIEAGLRLMNTTARHDLPDDDRELNKLAYLLRAPSSSVLVQQCQKHTRENRRLFDELFAAQR